MPNLAEWKRYYDGWARRDPAIASTGHAVAGGDFAALGRQLADWLGLEGRERALDVGCASGTLTSHWAPRAADVTGVDFSEGLVADANRRHAGTGLHFRTAEAACLPFEDGSFDAVVAFNVLLSLPDHDYARAAIDEIERVAAVDASVVLGSLPDMRLQEHFFALREQSAAWPRRVAGRLKRLLVRRSGPSTRLLWFDIEALAAGLRGRGWSVAVHRDPPFANYRDYRKTLVLRRGAEVRA